MREIDPKKVPDMMLSGELRFGMELEFQIYRGDKWELRKFVGFQPDLDPPRYLTAYGRDSTRWSEKARFPLPKLRDGDPVVVSGGNAHFYKFCGDSAGIWVYSFNDSPWTARVRNQLDYTAYANWRLPTKQELQSSGYRADQIAELESRRCVG